MPRWGLSGPVARLLTPWNLTECPFSGSYRQPLGALCGVACLTHGARRVFKGCEVLEIVRLQTRVTPCGSIDRSSAVGALWGGCARRARAVDQGAASAAQADRGPQQGRCHGGALVAYDWQAPHGEGPGPREMFGHARAPIRALAGVSRRPRAADRNLPVQVGRGLGAESLNGNGKQAQLVKVRQELRNVARGQSRGRCDPSVRHARNPRRAPCRVRTAL